MLISFLKSSYSFVLLRIITAFSIATSKWEKLKVDFLKNESLNKANLIKQGLKTF